MAGRQPPSLLTISASCTAISWCRAQSTPASVFSRSDVVQTHFSRDPPDEGHTALKGGMRRNAANAFPPRVRWAARAGSEVNDLSPPPLLVPPVLAGFRAEVDNIEASTVRVPQRLRYIMLMLCATSARAYVVSVLAGVR